MAIVPVVDQTTTKTKLLNVVETVEIAFKKAGLTKSDQPLAQVLKLKAKIARTPISASDEELSQLQEPVLSDESPSDGAVDISLNPGSSRHQTGNSPHGSRSKLCLLPLRRRPRPPS